MRTNITCKIIVMLVCITGLISAGLPSQNKYKNLKILPKDISEKDLDKVMEEYEHALGVGCDYCHTKSEKPDELDFPSDKKPEKLMCRKMMTMTAMINNKYFNTDNKNSTIQAVTCITCHRGKPRPEISDSTRTE